MWCVVPWEGVLAGGLMTTCNAQTRKSALLNTLGVAPKLRQNRFKYSSTCATGNQIHPTVSYQWQRQFFENGTAAF